MANFIQEKYNSMPEQVEENKKNIKELINIIKPVYRCSGSLNTASISVAKSLTNADENTVDGWLYDNEGNLFKITGGDEYSLLIEYYTTLRGFTGDTGETGNSFLFANTDLNGASISMSTLSITPNNDIKINDLVLFTNLVIGQVTSTNPTTTNISKVGELSIDVTLSSGSYITNTQPTLNGGVYELTINDITNLSSGETLKSDDIIIYCDSLDDNKVKEIYKIIAINDNDLTLDIVGKIGGSKEYIHNIRAYGTTSGSYGQVRVTITIINDDNTPFTYSTLRDYLYNKGYTTNAKLYTDIRGYSYNTTNYYVSIGLYVANLTSNIKCYGVYQNSYDDVALRIDAIDTFDDYVSEK